MPASPLLHSPAPARPILLDTDLGGDIDDTWALALACLAPEVDLRLISMAVDDTPRKAQLVAKMLQTAGATQIPIGLGPQTSQRELNHGAWLDGYDITQYPGRMLPDGIGALREQLRALSAPVTLVAIGPATNLRALLQLDPKIAGQIDLIWMAGGIDIGYFGRPTPEPECNVIHDLEAARHVLQADWQRFTLVPIDGCGDVRLEGAEYAAIRDCDAPWCRIIMENYALWKHRPSQPAEASSILFDTVAVCAAFDEQYFDYEEIPLAIDAGGVTVRAVGGRRVRCLMKLRDRAGFYARLIETLTGKTALTAK
jgi:inosine-uridine nucleoside N-ribohydrolase